MIPIKWAITWGVAGGTGKRGGHSSSLSQDPQLFPNQGWGASAGFKFNSRFHILNKDLGERLYKHVPVTFNSLSTRKKNLKFMLVDRCLFTWGMGWGFLVLLF